MTNYNGRQLVGGSLIQLNCVFQDNFGNLLDVDGAAVTIVGPGNQIFLADQLMNRTGYGTYNYLWQSPAELPIGGYSEIYEGFTAGQIKKARGQFEIVATDAFNRPPQIATKTGQLLNLLRDLLADNIPNIRRKQWDDEELISFLNVAVMDMNGYPAVTNYTLDSVPYSWYGIVLEGAVAWALRAWIIDYAQYDVDFNDNGLSVSIRNTLDHYLTMYNDAVARFTAQATLLKKNTRPLGMNIISGLVSFNLRSLRMSQLASIANQR